MAQRSILHPHRGSGAFHGGDATALIHRAILHAKPAAVEIRHGVHFRGLRIQDFARGTVTSLHRGQIRRRISTGKENIALLFVSITRSICIILIEIHGTAAGNVNRIPEFNRLICCSGERNHISTAASIDTPQAVGSADNLCILLEED